MAFEDVRVTGLDWVRGTEEPLNTFSRPIEKISWDEVALDNRAAFAKNLRASGLSEQSVSEALAVRDASAAEMVEAIKRLKPYENTAFRESPPELIEAQHFYSAKRESALKKLGAWWKTNVTVLESIQHVVKIPLFVLGTPSVPNCKAEWTNEIVSGISNGWTLQLAGSGLGSDAGSTYVESANFQASSGQTKLIIGDVALQLEHIEIRQKKGPPVRQWRIDLTSVAEAKVWLGAKLLFPDAVPPRGDFVRPFPLADDPSGAPATYEKGYTTCTAKKVNVGLDVRGVKLGLTASSDFGSTIKIKYTLISGVDYALFYARDCDGYVFGPTPESS